MSEKSDKKPKEDEEKKSLVQKLLIADPENIIGAGLLATLVVGAVAGLATLACWGGCGAYKSIRDFYRPEEPKIEELAPNKYIPEFPKQDPSDLNPIAYSPKRQQPFSNTNNYSQV